MTTTIIALLLALLVVPFGGGPDVAERVCEWSPPWTPARDVNGSVKL